LLKLGLAVFFVVSLATAGNVGINTITLEITTIVIKLNNKDFRFDFG